VAGSKVQSSKVQHPYAPTLNIEPARCTGPWLTELPLTAIVAQCVTKLTGTFVGDNNRQNLRRNSSSIPQES
jgi:hypothetical protein